MSCRANPGLTLRRFNDSRGRAARYLPTKIKMARNECQSSRHDCSYADVKKRSDADKNQVDREQEHSNIFCHNAFGSEVTRLPCTQKNRRLPYCVTASLHTEQFGGSTYWAFDGMRI